MQLKVLLVMSVADVLVELTITGGMQNTQLRSLVSRAIKLSLYQSLKTISNKLLTLFKKLTLVTIINY